MPNFWAKSRKNSRIFVVGFGKKKADKRKEAKENYKRKSDHSPQRSCITRRKRVVGRTE